MRLETEQLFPLTLTRLHDWKIVVVGGGPVGERKLRGLLAAGGEITLVAPTATAQLTIWADQGRIVWRKRAFQPDDLVGARLVIAATNSRTVNEAVAREAHRRSLLVNVADAPHEGNIHLPAVHRSGDLVIAVSTLSRKPRLAQTIRDRISAWLEPHNDRT